ncbi:MAG: hypothetical protein EXR11_07055 [Rhodospirillaceae bacterium]|nr:hypothetical protein [Rhodospirillaceae bacterium]
MRRQPLCLFGVFDHCRRSDHLCGILYRAEVRHDCLPAVGKPAHHQPKIRIGYVSADFHNHATVHLMAGLFEAHDRAKFETIAVSYGADDQTPQAARVRASFDRFIDARTMSDSQLIDMLRGLQLDIAVDLKGFTKDARPPARVFGAHCPGASQFPGLPRHLWRRLHGLYHRRFMADPARAPRGLCRASGVHARHLPAQ